MKTADQMVRELAPHMSDALVALISEHAQSYAGYIAHYALEQKTVGAVKQILIGAENAGTESEAALVRRRDQSRVALTPLEEASQATRKASRKRRK